ncbi:hypothetical protein AM493_14295 [Flavobacterium akiainvivens]|uniref:Uncharacterized protein n=2 Tax=Flavobacterium akiainvivens TaxID=1202724 RepID=A0A0M8MEB1_9FLAO|nr:hypothetical protein AM493_14295 [Flavobacterium akiainvivens]SFQ58495.1 hypothetical protein SAMN05444144_10913 [Flavobacterium akiainvivens]
MEEYRRTGEMPAINYFSRSKINLDYVPVWVKIVGILLFAYTAFNFYTALHTSDGGMPNIENGQYVLTDHGKRIKTITPAEYTYYKANETRMFSGHLLLFYVVSAFILFPKKQHNTI